MLVAMCGRFALHEPVEDLVARFAVDEVEPGVDTVRPRWNVAPTQPVMAVRADRMERRLWMARWGLVPPWAANPSVGSRMINARAETLATSPAFRRAFARRRCLVPASGFYEWSKTRPPGGSGQAPAAGARRSAASGPRQPFYFRRADGSPLALAALWELWRDAEGNPLHSCTIVTTAANSDLERVHHRMPLVLEPSAWERWLAPEPLGAADAAALLAPPTAQLLVGNKVSSRVNSAANDGPDLVRPLDELPLSQP